MRYIGSLLLLPVILVLSCGSGPKPVEQPPAAPVAAAPAPAPVSPPPQAVPEPVPQTPQTPPPPATAPEAPPAVVQPPPQAAEAFDPSTVTEEKYETTKADVNTLIEELNKIIKARDYNAWTGYLSDSYFKQISSTAFLSAITEDLYKRDQTVASNLGRDPKRVSKKILRTPKDYFDNVVVPSRSNDRMDDMDFISDNRVKAYTVDTKGNRLVLYDLEQIGGKWKIIN